jgi:hypothetical protein
MDDRVQPTAVETFAKAVSDENKSRWSWDKRIPIFSVASICASAIIFGGGWLITLGGTKETLAESIDKLTAQEHRIEGLETAVNKTNLDVSDIRGDIKEILALLRQPRPDRSPR